LTIVTRNDTIVSVFSEGKLRYGNQDSMPLLWSIPFCP
jgi:hypothetical protein